MSEAIKLIVDSYVKLSARKALEDLKAHRHRLANKLKSLNGPLDLSSSIKLLEEDLTVIDAGLARLNSAATA
jgi:hypothetical protein